MEALFWIGLGALLGIAAAQKKGFSVAGGAIGGMLLGPLAVLLFFVSGITGGDARKKCRFCAEWIKTEAIVCPHCQREQHPEPQPAVTPVPAPPEIVAAAHDANHCACGTPKRADATECWKCGRIFSHARPPRSAPPPRFGTGE